MKTQMLKSTMLALVLAIGMCGHEAMAMEEVVVYGTDASIPAAQTDIAIKISMSQFAEAANKAQKTQLNNQLANWGAKRIQIAAAKLPTRG